MQEKYGIKIIEDQNMLWQYIEYVDIYEKI